MAQSPFPEPGEVELFYKTKTCVVLEDKMFSEYNIYIKKAVNDFWNITEYEFISVEDFNVRREDGAYSFIVLTQTKFDKDKSRAVFNFINLLMGKDVGRIEDLPEFCAIPLSFAGAEDAEYAHKLGIVLRFMQAHVDHIKEDPSLKGKKYLKYYNKFAPEAKEKTILISENDLVPDLRTPQAIEKYYPHNLKIVSDEEIQQAINDNAANVLILHKVGPEGTREGGICFKMLIGTDDARMYFYGEHKITPKNRNGLLVNDLKRIGRF
jgi:hypothetical protein